MQTKTLGEICRPKQWKTVATSQLSEEGYPVYGANGIIGKYKEYNHENETILVTCRGATCGALNICEPFSYVNGNAMALDNLDQSIDLKYLYYFLKGRGFHDVISGSAQPQIIRSAIERIEVPICDIETQKEITKSFAKIEKLIESKKKILANLDNLVKARFVEMFDGDYEEVELSELGKISTGSTPPMKNKDFYENADMPFFKPGDFIDGVSNIDCSESFVDARAESVSRIMDPGTVAVTCIGIIGKIGIIKRRGICNQQINFIAPNDNVDSIYLAYAIDTKKKFMQEKANAPVVPILNKTNFSKVTIPFAPVELQNQFAAFVAQVDKSKFAVQKSLEKTQQLFDSLMQEYFG